MPTPIQAAVCRDFSAPLAIESLRIGAPGARQVRVRVAVCAICHSDITYRDGGWGGNLPAVYGHEVAGEVIEAGAEAGIAPGTRVIATLMRACGSCFACERGHMTQCQSEFAAAPHLTDADGTPVLAGLKTGGFAEQVIVDRSQVASIPDALPFNEASLLACGVLTGWGAVVNTAQVPVGSTVAVVGCGGVGLNCLQGAAHCGASLIAALDLAAEKLAIAKQFGATHTAASPDEALALTDGRGFDYVFMAANGTAAVATSASLVARMGALVLVGMAADGELASLNTTLIANNAQRILGSKMGGARLRVDIPRLLHLHAQGKLKLTELVGNTYPLEKINEAIDDSRSGGSLRNLIVFD